MKITVAELKRYSKIDKAIIHSLDMCLYQASVIVESNEYYLADKHGKLLRSFNILDMQAMLATLPISHTVLRQQSAYDEMVGQPIRTASNAIEVPLGNADFAVVNKASKTLH